MIRRSSKIQAPVTGFAAAMPSGPIALAMAFAGAMPAIAAPLYYDGTAAGTWTNLADWSTDPALTTPDPAVVPGALDDVFFNVSGVNGNATIALGGVQSANSLTFNNTGTTTITGAATAPTVAFNLGAGGITVGAGAGVSSIAITGSTNAFSPLVLTASQTWNNLSPNTFVVGNNFNSSAGTNLTISNGTFMMNNVSNNSTVQGNLLLQNSAKLQIQGDFTVNGGLDGGAANTIENNGAASKWMFVSNPTGVTNNFGGTIQGNPLNSAVRLGYIKRGQGTQNITGSVTGERIAVESGTINLGTGASLNMANAAGGANSQVVVGNVAAQNAILNINGGNVTSDRTGGTAINTASAANAQAFVRLNSGSIATTGNEMRIGSSGAGSYAAHTQNGGSVSSQSWIGIGSSAATAATGDRAVVNLNGGTFSASTNNFITIAIGNVHSVAVVNVNGGTLNANATNNGGLLIGERGNGTVNVISGTVNAATRGVGFGDTGAGTGWNGTLNLLGGTVNTNRVGKTNTAGPAGAGVSILNFNGGSLNATTANTTFLEGLTSANVYSGGGTISNGGNAITIAQNLVAPAGNGVSTAGLTITGSGFLDTPLVSITGDGTGAKGIATIDSSGNLTGITITNPGTGYTTASIDLLKTADGSVTGGRGATYAITGTPTLAANTAGGLTYSGSGITRLTGANTYGQSTISSGTNLQVDGSLSGGVVTTAGGTLSGVGSIGGNVTITGGTLSLGDTGGAGAGSMTVAGSISLDSSSFIQVTINDETVGNHDRLNNTGVFNAGSATLIGNFNDTNFSVGYDPVSLAAATRYTIVSGPVIGMFGNASLIGAGDLAALGLSAGSYEVTLGSQRFYVEQGSFNLVPIPEPSTTGLLAGLASLGLMRRRRR